VDHGYLFASQTRGDLKRGSRVRVRYLYQVSMSMTHGIPCGHDRARCSSGHDGKRELKAGVKRQSRGRARASGHNVKSVVFDAQLTPSVGFCSVSDLGLAGFAVKKRAVGAYYTCDINVLRVKYASPPRGGAKLRRRVSRSPSRKPARLAGCMGWIFSDTSEKQDYCSP